MNILIIGGGGVVGQRLGRVLAERGTLDGQQIEGITLADIADPAPIEGGVPVTTTTCDITDPASVEATIGADTDVVYLLAAIVSAHAEAEFETGMNINLFGVHNVLERCRALGTVPKVIFSSSIAVYGGETPDPITDHSSLNPQTSYGTQKAIGEMLLTDYHRKGFIDGRGVRLPTISVRPGKPNRAASSFMSSIIREPLNGVEAVCPVDETFQHYYLSLRRCVENLVKVAELPREAMGLDRVMQMPGRTWTIREMIDAMTRVAGPEAAERIKWEPDAELMKIVGGWRYDIHADKALALGLEADESFEDNVRYYMEDDLPPKG